MKQIKITKTENGHKYIKTVDEGLVSIYKMQGWEVLKKSDSTPMSSVQNK